MGRSRTGEIKRETANGRDRWRVKGKERVRWRQTKREKERWRDIYREGWSNYWRQ